MTAGCAGCFIILIIFGIINAIIEGVKNSGQKIAADCGDSNAQLEVGLKYYDGEDMDKPDYKKAMEYFTKASDKGNADAQYYIAKMYEDGKGVIKDSEEAFRWYRKAAKNGDSTSQCIVAKKCLELNTKEAREEALEWVKKATDKGSNEGLTILDFLITKGYLSTIEKAENGDSEAQLKIVPLYSLGQEIFSEKFRSTEALKWLRKSAENDNAMAQMALATILLPLNEIDEITMIKNIKKDTKEALKWLKKAAKNGKPEAMRIIGGMYEEGIGLEPDDEIAFEWYKKAADEGDNDSKLAIANMYRDGRGVNSDYSKALELYKELSEEDYSEAQFQLAMYYGFNQPKKMLYWLKKAVELDNANAECILGGLYSVGKVVEQDHTIAYNLLSRAAAQGHKQAIQGKSVYDKARAEENQARARQTMQDIGNFIEGTADMISTAKRWHRKIFK